MQVFLLSFKTILRIVGLCLAMISLAYIDANAQLLERGKGRLKSIRSEKPGFLFFNRKIKSAKPDNSNKRVFIVPHPESEIPPNRNKNHRPAKIRTSRPVSYNKNGKFVPIISSSPGEQKIKVRNSKPQKETYFNFWVTKQMKKKRRIGPPEDSNNLYNKSRLSLLRRPFGQWKRASYRGHHVAWNQRAKKAYYQFTSQTVSKHPGDTKVLVSFLANISDKMKMWKQSHYKGRSDGLSKFGQRDYERQQSIIVSNFEGDIKVKKRKGGDMHPSIVYISGKKFNNSNWKEKWRKLNIIWVRINPGKETPEGAKEKYKVKYDKEERDIWTY